MSYCVELTLIQLEALYELGAPSLLPGIHVLAVSQLCLDPGPPPLANLFVVDVPVALPD